MRFLLVIGTSNESGRRFLNPIWSKVVGQCLNSGSLDSATKQVTQKRAIEQLRNSTDPCQPTRLTLPLEPCQEDQEKKFFRKLPGLIPIGLSAPVHRPSEFQNALEEILVDYDIWSVISAAPSEATELLIEPLAPTGIPLLLAVDSTTLITRQTRLREKEILHPRQMPPILQLVANNSQQASAAYAALQALRNQLDSKQKIWILTPDHTNPYANDLFEQLQQLSETPSADLQLDRVTHLEQGGGTQNCIDDGTLAVVYIGYNYSELEDLMLENPSTPFLIADGVHRSDCQAWANREKRSATTLFFEPTMRPDDTAACAYKACLNAIRSKPRSRDRTFLEAVRNHLEGPGFRFTADGANLAAGFIPSGHWKRI